MDTKDLIKKLNLQPHPEGGYYKETYRSQELVTTRYGTDRNVSTAIYYLLEDEDKSHFHRIQSDELWFFHHGVGLEIFVLENGDLQIIKLGNDLENGETPQAMVKGNCWFAASVKNKKGYSLVSCTVAPGFDFADFELAKKEALLLEYPMAGTHIEQFTREITT